MSTSTQGSNRDEAYYKRLADMHTEALWYLDMATYSGQPCVPHVWHWKELMPALRKSTEVFQFGQGLEDRRALSLINPTRQHGATSTLTASLQMINPGEVARVHRHTLTAVRFIISGNGGYTVNDGEKFGMEAGDLILTPSWAWHGHGNDGTEPMFWMDGLESPLLTMMGGDLYEDYPTPTQAIIPTPDNVPTSIAQFGGAGMVPVNSRHSGLHSPLTIYKWGVAEEALRRLQRLGDDPHDGAIMEYINPLTGGPAVPTMAYYLQLLKAGFHGKAHRHTTNTIYLVVRGSGRSIIDGKEHPWEENDIMAIPSWRWHEHIADKETFLMSFTDVPVRRPIGLYQTEEYTPNGGYQVGG